MVGSDRIVLSFISGSDAVGFHAGVFVFEVLFASRTRASESVFGEIDEHRPLSYKRRNKMF